MAFSPPSRGAAPVVSEPLPRLLEASACAGKGLDCTDSRHPDIWAAHRCTLTSVALPLLNLDACSRRIEEMRDNRARKVTSRVRSGPRPALRLIVRPPSRWERARRHLAAGLVRVGTCEGLLIRLRLRL